MATPTAGSDWLASTWLILGLGWQLGAFLTIPSVLLNRRGQARSALTWMLALYALPFLGLLLWWLIGRRYLVRKKRQRRSTEARLSENLSALRGRLPRGPEAALFPFRKIPDEIVDAVFPATAENSVRLLVGASAAYPAMEEAIAAAREHVHFLFYIWNDDVTGRRFRDLLARKAREGVDVRIFYDSFGSGLLSHRFLKPLREAGAQVIAGMASKILTFFPTFNFRNHRKIIVCDGRVGFIGGLNIGDEYLLKYDIAIRLVGPVLDQLQEVFADDWFYATGEELSQACFYGRWSEQSSQATDTASRETDAQNASCALVASGPHLEKLVMRDALFIAIGEARRRILITTPYFIPDQATVVALQTAVYRGVDVRLLVPGESDVPIVRIAARAYYDELLALGVRIFEYQGQILHAKTLLIDEELSVIGSANFDNRSFRLNFEINCFIESLDLNKELTALFHSKLARSLEIDPDQFEQRGTISRLVEAIANLLAPLL